MNNGLQRFQYYLEQLGNLLDQARKESDPATWLFKNNARTQFFMLEGLAKLYAGLHDHESFKKLNDWFKKAEDGFGKMDHYEAVYSSMSANEKIPAEHTHYFLSMLEESTAKMNEMLEDEDWISSNRKRINKINDRLTEMNWLSPSEEAESIVKFYAKAIQSIGAFLEEKKGDFKDIEHDVHEFRRKLRWLSIYAQALQGVVQFDPIEKATEIHKKYLTDAIVKSPFNKLPSLGDCEVWVTVDKPSFLALSWTIAELGAIKDDGLMLTALCEAIQYHTGGSINEALIEAYSTLGDTQTRMEVILQQAEVVSHTFYEEKHLEHLITGTSHRE